MKAFDQMDNELTGETWPFTMTNGQPKAFDGLKDTLNTILKNKDQKVNLVSICIDGIEIIKSAETDISSAESVTITYPGEIELDHEVAIALDYLTHASSNEGEGGSVDLPEDLPLEYKEVNLFCEVANTSPASLTVEVWLSSTPINLADLDHIQENNPKAVKNKITIGPGTKVNPATVTSVLTFDADEFTRLIEAETIHHLVTYINTTESADPIAADDYLTITAWADASCTINKR